MDMSSNLKKCKECLNIIIKDEDNQDVCSCYPEYLQTVLNKNLYNLFKNNITCVKCNEEYYYTKTGELFCHCDTIIDTIYN